MTNHQHFMQLAIAQAKLAWGIAKPNPAVGCVIVAHDKLIGQGHTQEAGLSHAEVMALREAGHQAQGATAYITLEPCAHQGRTPPCSQALINAGIRQVVYGCQDPNPLIQGKGVQQLACAGISVIGPVLPELCAAINPGFMHKMITGKPYIFSKLATSLDGCTAMASGESQWITGPESRAKVHQLRAQSCALVTGVGTVLSDNPNLTCRMPELLRAGMPEEIVKRIIPPLRVILDSQLRTPIDAKVLQNPKNILIITCVADPQKHQPYLRKQVEISTVSSANGQVSLPEAMALLDQRGCQQIMLEAGVKLNTSMLSAGLLNGLTLFMAPKLLGANGCPLFDIAIDRLADAWQLSWQNAERCGEDLFLRLTLP